ncbi:hypothetical protein Hanom_Chr09g00852431 [Helianthus anomalus]
MKDMARLKSSDLRDSEMFSPCGGTHNPPCGSSTCDCLPLLPPLPSSPLAGTSFTFFTYSKNSATCRAYLHIHIKERRYVHTSKQELNTMTSQLKRKSTMKN